MNSIREMRTVSQKRTWGAEACPSCNGTKMVTDHSTGDLVCIKCGLVIY